MDIKLKDGLLLIKKHKNTKLSVDMAVEDSDNDKDLITGEIINSGTPDYSKGETVIFGKYALLKLVFKGIDYHILDVEDVIGLIDYKEE